jgi:3-methylcrotonyl-CoA carboxylase alpha subunit
MISKLIVHGEDRETALNKLIAALKSYELVGLPTNIDFLVQCAQHETFREAGACNTGFLEHYMGDILKQNEEAKTEPVLYAAAAFLKLLHAEHRVGITASLEESRRSQGNPWSSLSGSWRVGSRAKRTLTVDGEDNVTMECLSNDDGSFDIGVLQEEHGTSDWFHMDGTVDKDGSLSLLIDGSKRKAFSSFVKEDKSGGTTLHLWSKDPSDEAYSVKVSLEDPFVSMVGSEEPAGSSSQGLVLAPMPGKIVQINVKVGDTVKKDDVLIMMEAMKMQHSIRAPRDGVVVELCCSEDSVVDDGHVLAEVDDHLEEAA